MRHIQVTTAPVLEPLTATEAREFLRVDGTDENTAIETYIAAARAEAEHDLQRSLLTQTITMTLSSFPSEIRLPRPPIQSVSSVKYYDDDNVQKTLTVTTDYLVRVGESSGCIYRPSASSWPTTYDRPDAVEVIYVAGWTSAALVPAEIRAYIRMVVGSIYANREAFVNGTTSTQFAGRFLDGLLDRWRVYEQW